jgi:hypothetical protein
VHRFGPETVFATYRVKPGRETEFLRLLRSHWPTLDRLGLTNGEPALLFRGTDATGGTVFTEVFTWRDGKAVETAHHDPEVQAIWGPMEPLLEERLGRPKWEFPHLAPVG